MVFISDGINLTRESLHVLYLFLMFFVWPLVSDVNMTGVVCESLVPAPSLRGAQGCLSIIKLISEQEDINTKHEADRY